MYTHDIAVLVENGQLNARNFPWQQHTGSDASNTSTYHCNLQSLAVSFNEVVRLESYLQLADFVDRLFLYLEIRREWVHPIIIILQRLCRWQVFSGNKVYRGP